MQNKQTGRTGPATEPLTRALRRAFRNLQPDGHWLTGFFMLIVAGSAGAAIDLDVTFAGPDDYTPGTSTTGSYTLTIENVGDASETAPDITTGFPAGTTLSWSCSASGSSSCGTPVSGNGNLSRTTDTIEPGDAVEYLFDVAFDSDMTAHPLTATASVEDSNGVASDVEVESDRLPEADLSIEKSADTGTYIPGESVSDAYTITVSNDGPSDAGGILLEDTAPADMTIGTWSCEDSGGNACPNGAGSGDISETFTIPAGETFTWTLDASYPADADTESLENTATLTVPASLNDPDDANPSDGNHVESDTTSEARDAQVDLSVEFTSAPTSYVPGGSGSHTIEFDNAGPTDARTAAATLTFVVDNANDLEAINFTCSPASQCAVDSGDLADFVTTPDGTDPFFEVALSLGMDIPVGSPVTIQLDTDFDSRALTDPLVLDAAIAASTDETETDSNNNVDSNSMPIDRRANISIVKTATVEETAPNAEFEYILEVTNAGPSDVGHGGSGDDAIFVDDQLSNDLNGQAGICPGGDGSQPCWRYCASDAGDASNPISPDSCPTEVISGQGDLVDVPLSIAAGNTSTVVVHVSTASSAGETIDNTAHVELADSGPVDELGGAADNESSDSVNVIIGGDISVAKTDGTTTAVPGEEHSYTVTVANEGYIGVNDVRVIDDLPIFGPGTDAGFDSGSVSFQCEAFEGACCNHNSAQCGSGGAPIPLNPADALDHNVDLPAGSSVVITIAGDLATQASGTLVNTASVELPAGFEDPNAANNSATDDDTELVPQADLVIAKKLSDLDDQNAPPFTLTYQIDVTNNGPSLADDAVIQDLLDDTRLADGTAGWYCEVINASGGTECLTTSETTPATGMSSVEEDVTLGPGGSVRLMVTVDTQSTEVEGEVENTATVTSTAGDDSVTIRSGLTGKTDLTISKTSNRTEIAPGTEIDYLITVTNEGPDNAFGASVTDSFPPQIDDVTWTCEATTPVPGNLNFQNIHGTDNIQARKAVGSADGRHVYVMDATESEGKLLVFDRDATPGLTFGRISLLETEIEGINDGNDTGGTVRGMAAPIDMMIAPDGGHVYVLSAGTDDTDPAVATFQRNTDMADQVNYGRLTFVDRVTDGIPATPRRMAMTDDHIYISGDEAISISARDPALGIPVHDINLESNLPPAPGPLTIDPAGPFLFAGSSNDTGIFAYAIEPAGGGNPAGRLAHINDVADADTDTLVELRLAPDASQLYGLAAGASRLVMIDFDALETGSDPTTDLMPVEFSYDGNAVGGSGLLDSTARIDISTDGEHLLLSNQSVGGLSRLRRDPASGGLTFEALLTSADAGHSALADASNLLITPDGRHVLVTLDGSGAGSLARYSRLAPDPLFAFIEADSQDDPDASGNPIADLRAPNDVAVSPDGSHVYAVSLPDDSIVAFRRDPSAGVTDGTLGGHLNAFAAYRQDDDGIDGLTDARRILISNDGESVFVTSESQDSLAVFDRNTDEDSATYGELTFRAAFFDGQNGVDGLAGAQGMAIDGTGNHLYVAGRFDSAIAVFDRETDSGDASWRDLAWRGVISNDEASVSGLHNIRDLAITPDGDQLLGVSTGDNALVVFNRENALADEDFGELTFVEARQNGIGAQPVALAIPGAQAAGAGEHVYVVGQNSHSIAVLRRVTDPDNSSFGQVQPIEILQNGDSGISSLSGPRDIIVSPDGKRVYVASENRDAVIVLDRDLNAASNSFGRLNAVEVRRNNVAGVSGIAQVRALAISRSSRNVYAAGFGSGSIASFLLGTGSLCTAGGGGDINDRVDIGVGGTLQYRATGMVRADATGVLVNSAQVTVPERFDDTAPGNNTDTDEVVLKPEADLVLDKSSDDVSVTAGQPAHFEITITNPGPSNLMHSAGMPLTVTDNLDTGQFDAANATWTCEASGSGVLEFIEAYLAKSDDNPNGFESMQGVTALTRLDAAGSIPALAAASVIDNAVLIFPLDDTTGALDAPVIIKNGDVLPGGTVGTLSGAAAISVSADGRFLYVASRISDAVTVFEVFDNAGTIEVDLVDSYDGLVGLDQAIHLTLGPDDDELYVAGVNDDAIAVFERDASTGTLNLIDTEQNGVSAGGATVMGLTDVEHVAVSPDGSHLFALSGSTGQIAVFGRSSADGTLTWLDHYGSAELGTEINGASSAVFAPGGDSMYVAASASDRIVLLDIGADGELSLASSVSQDEDDISGLGGVRRLLLTEDGTHLYATSPVVDSVIWFTRDTADGSLDYGGVRAHSSALVNGLLGATAMAYHPTLGQLYIAGTQQPAVSRFQRQADSFCPASGTGSPVAVPFDIAAGGTVRFEIEAEVLPGVDGAVSNTATMNASGDSDTGNNTDTQTSPISQQADLSITKDDGLREFDGLLDAAAIAGTASSVYVAGPGDGGIAVLDRNDEGGSPDFGRLTFAEALIDGDAGLSGLNGVSDLALDSTAETLYASAREDNSVVVFNRDGDGRLSPAQLLQNGTGGISGISGAQHIELAPDGKHVYVLGSFSNAIAAMTRVDEPGAPDHGQLSSLQTLENGVNGVLGIANPVAAALSPDGEHVYVLGREDDTLAVFDRNANSGSANFGRLGYVTHYTNNVDGIAGLAGVRDLAITDDGAFVHVLGDRDGTLAVFERDSDSGELSCVANTADPETECFFRQDGFGDTTGLAGAGSIHLDSAAGEIYVAGDGSISRFTIDPEDGTPAFADQIANGDPAPQTGGQVFGLEDTAQVLVPLDGGQLYAASAGSNSVITFDRSPGAPGSLEFTDIIVDGLGGIAPGEDVVYTIVVENHGPSDVPDATVVDEFPGQFENVSWSCTSANGALCPASGVGDLNTEVSLPAGGRVTFSAGGRIKDNASGRLVNTASVSAGGVLDPVADNNEATDDDTVLSPAMDVIVEFQNSGGEATPGLPVDYEFHALNMGPSYADDIGIKDQLPAAVYDASWECYPQPRAGLLASSALTSPSLDEHRAIEFSTNGRHAYAAGADSGTDAIGVFQRNPISGALELKQTLMQGSDGVAGLQGVSGLALSADGRFLYAAAPAADSIARFERDTTSGELTFAGFIQDGDAGVEALGGVSKLLLSTDGARLYAISGPAEALSTFTIDEVDGTLTQTDVLRNGDPLPDESFVLDGLNGAMDLAWSEDGSHLLVVARENQTITAFELDAFSGALSWAAIAYADGSGMLADPVALTISESDGVFVASPGADRVDFFEFSPGSEEDDAGFSFVETLDAAALSIGSLDSPAAIDYDSDRRRLYIQHGNAVALVGLMRSEPEVIANYAQSSLTGISALSIGPSGRHLYTLGDDLTAWARKRGSRCPVAGTGALERQQVDIAAGGAVEFTVSGHIQANALGDMRYTVEAAGPLPEQELNPADNIATVVDDLVPAPDLSLAKSASPDPVVAGEEIVFLLETANGGPSDALAASLLDQPPVYPEIGGLLSGTGQWSCQANPPLGSADEWTSPEALSGLHVGSDGVYATSADADAVLVFPHSSGSLGTPQVIANGDAVAGGGSVVGLDGANAVAASSDEHHLYVTGQNEDSLVVFSRASTAEDFEFLERHQSGVNQVFGMINPVSVRISDDGANVYVAGDAPPLSGRPSIVIFSRDEETGALEYVDRQGDGIGTIAPESDVLDGIRSTWPTRDGRDLYAVATDSNALSRFSRDGEDGSLTFENVWRSGEAAGGLTITIDDPVDLAAGPGDQHLYVLGASGIAKFDRDDHGSLSYTQAWTAIPQLSAPRALYVDPAGTRLYLLDDSAIHVFARNWSDGSLSHRNRIERADTHNLFGDPANGKLWLTAAETLLAFPEMALSRCLQSTSEDDGIELEIDMGAGGYADIEYGASVHPSARGEVVNTADILPGAGADPQPADNTAESVTPIEVVSDLAMTKSGPLQAVAGETIAYQLVVSNAGPSSALGIGIDDFTQPAGALIDAEWTCTVIDNDSIGESSCPATGDGSNFTADLMVGDELIVDIVATVDPGVVGFLVNTAELIPEADATDPTPGDQSSSVTTEVEAVADVAVSKSLVDDAPVAGDAVTWNIVISNAGPSNAPRVAVADVLDQRLMAPQWTCQGADGGTCPAATGNGHPAFDIDLPVNGSAELTVSGQLGSDASGVLANTVDIAAAAPVTDPQSDNDSASTEHLIAIRPDLAVEIVAPLDPFDPDGPTDLPLTLTVTNLGPSDAGSAVVDVGFDAAVSLDAPRCSSSGSGWTCGAGVLASGEMMSWDLLVSDLPAAGNALVTDATVTTGDDDPNPANNQVSRSIDLVNGPDVHVEVNNAVDEVGLGDAVTYQITVANIGSVAAGNVDVLAPISADLINAQWTCTADGSANCTPTGSGDVVDTIALEPGETATYVLETQVDPNLVPGPGPQQQVVQTASASLAGNDDINEDNNDAEHGDTLRIVLFSDRFEAP